MIALTIMNNQIKLSLLQDVTMYIITVITIMEIISNYDQKNPEKGVPALEVHCNSSYKFFYQMQYLSLALAMPYRPHSFPPCCFCKPFRTQMLLGKQ